MKRRILLGLLVLIARSGMAGPSDFIEGSGVPAFLGDNFNDSNACLVIGLVDGSGSRVYSAGRLDNGTDGAVNGDTVFFIGSVSKTFTALLLEDAAERGEMKLDDPVAKHLPASVTVPAHGGREITLLDLATQSSGLPFNPGNMTGATDREQYESYTVEKMYAFLSGHKLNHDPGTEFGYSNVGMSLLGHAIARRTGTNFESLVVNRICQPLGMDSTCITLTPELKAHLAMGHDKSGHPSPPWKFQAYEPAGDIHSTANDLLKYAAAEAGLAPSGLATLMQKTHEIHFKDTRGAPELPGFGTFGRTAVNWVDRAAYQPPGMELLGHAGGAGSYHAWVGFDTKQRRGAVVLSTANDFSVECIGWTILQRLPLTKESLHDFSHEMEGLGFTFELDPVSHMVRLTKVFPKSPGSEAGLVKGLLIEKIKGVPTAGKSIAECSALFRTNTGAKVRLDIIDTARHTTNTAEVTRGKFFTGGG